MFRGSVFVCSRGAAIVLLLAGFLSPAYAQIRPARLLVTVSDQSGFVIPGATVVVLTSADAPAAPVSGPRSTSPVGIAVFEGLAPGRYLIAAEFPGFAKRLTGPVKVRSGDNRASIVLPLAKLRNEITVARDAQSVAVDPRERFQIALTSREIDDLSDLPAEMAQQLHDMAGPGSIIRVDSFEGAQLPPKAQIKSIHIVRDAFAAENHSAGLPYVEVITQPGAGRIRGGGNYRLRDDSLNARNPLTPTRGAEQTQAIGLNVGGSLVRNRSSFSLAANGQTAYDTPTAFVALPGGGRRSEVLNIRRPTDNILLSGLFDYAVTRDQMLRIAVQQSHATSGNLGIGPQDDVERAYSTTAAGTVVRLQQTGPLGRRAFLNTRIQLAHAASTNRSAVEAPTYQIAGARTLGGAQVKGSRHTRAIVAQSDADYVRGMHSLRSGVSFEAGAYRTSDSTNYLGSYYFESVSAFEQGRPRSYRRRIGDPNIQYRNLQAGAYVQDDARVRRALTFSPGVRVEAQTHAAGLNVSPRFGVAWAPFKSGTTTLRTSWGVFYDWLTTNTYEQALRVDGFRQREIDIANPPFPDPGDVGVVRPSNRYLLPATSPLARNNRVSVGIEQTISPRVRLSVSYAVQRGTRLLRGGNLNAPVNGVRPDASFVNIIAATPDAASRQHVLNAAAAISLSRPSAAVNRPRFNWRRTTFSMNYSAGKARNNTDGAFNAPASGSPAGEWGEMAGDVRPYRINANLNTAALKNVSLALTLNAMSGTPYTITTGRDNNGDLVYNDRPAGVGRNTARTPDFRALNGNLSYNLPAGRYRVALTLSVTNLTNRTNFGSYTGVMTSPFFRMPTAVLNPRKLDVGIGLNF